MIYLVRNGFDVLLSYADHIGREGGDVRDLDRFADSFALGDVANYGPWHEHVLAAYDPSQHQLYITQYAQNPRFTATDSGFWAMWALGMGARARQLHGLRRCWRLLRRRPPPVGLR